MYQKTTMAAALALAFNGVVTGVVSCVFFGWSQPVLAQNASPATEQAGTALAASVKQPEAASQLKEINVRASSDTGLFCGGIICLSSASFRSAGYCFTCFLLPAPGRVFAIQVTRQLF